MTTYPMYDPTSLIAGDKHPTQRAITLAGGQNPAPSVLNGVPYPIPLKRGTLLGRSAQGETMVSAKTGGNTGNGTLTMDPTTPVLSAALPGTYKVTFTAPTAYTVTDPNSATVGTGAVGTAFSTGNTVKFNTAAGSTAFVAGDAFNVTVVPADEYVVCKATATDGSQAPVAVLAWDTDTSSGAPVSSVAYFEGEFAGEIMTLDPSWTIPTLQAALRQATSDLYVRSVGVLG